MKNVREKGQKKPLNFFGIYQNGNFHWEKAKIMPAKIVKSDFAPLKICPVTLLGTVMIQIWSFVQTVVLSFLAPNPLHILLRICC